MAMVGMLLLAPGKAISQEITTEPTGQHDPNEQKVPADRSSSGTGTATGTGTAFGTDGFSCRRFVHQDVAEDARTVAVEDFLRSHSCPVQDLAPEFVLAAELNGLDYRLLPVLAVLETGCGRQAKNQNLFGWANGRKPFASFVHGIHFVAQRLRLAPHYAGKTVAQKLRVYNRRAWYRRKVLALMEKMPPAPTARVPAASLPAGSSGL
jgi:hypothetical protein